MSSPNQDFASALGQMDLSHSPVAVAFVATPPAGLPHIGRALPAGCGYWKHASEGHAFYTTAEDHQNCTVGAFTHNVTLPPAKAEELQSVVGTMVQLHYIKGDEVPNIPRLPTPMQCAAYAPLEGAPFHPDVVIFRGNARQVMLISEAARAAGVFDRGETMGRPACAMIPQTMAAGASVASVGCIGNRVYTDLGDDELYIAIPGRSIGSTLAQLATILNANVELEKFHRQRAADLAAS